MSGPTELQYFNCTGFYYDVEAPLTGGSTDALQFLVISAFVTFTPRVPTGFAVLISDLDLGGGNSGSTSLAIAPVTARIMGGQLCAINTTDSPGIQLLANTTPISTYLTAQSVQNGQLIYDVTFTDVVYAATNMYLNNFGFVAPTSATTVCITDPGLTQLPYQNP